ncbi:tetratricopeptide repeat protein [Candidatus Poribacteria bacterium]|nr:tetratricopeptide repeat protein [Candidatus Poribacteria bacterium]
MRTLFIAFCVGICYLLSACKGANNLEKHKEAVVVKTDRISGQRFRGKETTPSFLVRTDNRELYFFDEEIDQLIQQSTNFQLELADLGATSESVIYKNLGVSYLEQGKLDKAVVAFKKAIQIAPSFVEAHYLLADVYSLKGEGFLSRASLNRAMALDGSYIIDTVRPNGNILEYSIIELPPPAVLQEFINPIKPTNPPDFFQGPIKTGVPGK